MRPGGGAATERPCSSILPCEGAISPAIILRRVDFPQPDGPSRLVNPPFATSNATPLSADRPFGNVFPTSHTDKAGAASGGRAAPRGAGATASLLSDIIDHFTRNQVPPENTFLL